MNLTHLSLQRAPRLHNQMPDAPTNAERLRALRVALAMRPASVGNVREWNFNGSQPAANPPPNLPNPAGCLLSIERGMK